MKNSTKEKLITAIEILADKIKKDKDAKFDSDDAVKYTQAALNVANTIGILTSADKG